MRTLTLMILVAMILSIAVSEARTCRTYCTKDGFGNQTCYTDCW